MVAAIKLLDRPKTNPNTFNISFISVEKIYNMIMEPVAPIKTKNCRENKCNDVLPDLPYLLYIQNDVSAAHHCVFF